MSEFLLDRNNIIYQEMMVHPAIFSHRHPDTVGIVADTNTGILQEVLKHSNVSTPCVINSSEILENDPRIKLCNIDWTNNTNTFDILIIAKNSTAPFFKHYLSALNNDGILVQLCGSPFDVSALKITQQSIDTAGFSDIQLLSFPQPHFPSGLRCALMAKKTGIFKKIREKDIFNKSFSTMYYNFDIHKAALVIPEFMRKELQAVDNSTMLAENS